MTEFTPLQLDVFDALADCPGARTPEELAELLDHSTGAVADALDGLRRQRRIERVSAWQLASGAEYALRSRLTLTDYQIDIMSDLQNASGARTIEELAYDSGDDEDLLAETMDWLARNSYVQPVSAYRCPLDSPVATAAIRDDRYADTTDPYVSTMNPYVDSSVRYDNSTNSYANTADPHASTADPYANSADRYGNTADPYASTTDPYDNTTDPYDAPTDPYATPVTGLPTPSWLDPEPGFEPEHPRRRVPSWVRRSH